MLLNEVPVKKNHYIRMRNTVPLHTVRLILAFKTDFALNHHKRTDLAGDDCDAVTKTF